MALEQYLFSKYSGYSREFIEHLQKEEMADAQLCLARAINCGEGLVNHIYKTQNKVGYELREGVIQLLINAKKLDFKVQRAPTDHSYLAQVFPQDSLEDRFGYLEESNDSFYKKLPEFYKAHDKKLPPEELVALQISVYEDLFKQAKYPKAFENQENFQAWLEIERDNLMDHQDMLWCAVMENSKLWNPDAKNKPKEK